MAAKMLKSRKIEVSRLDPRNPSYPRSKVWARGHHGDTESRGERRGGQELEPRLRQGFGGQARKALRRPAYGGQARNPRKGRVPTKHAEKGKMCETGTRVGCWQWGDGRAHRRLGEDGSPLCFPFPALLFKSSGGVPSSLGRLVPWSCGGLPATATTGTAC